MTISTFFGSIFKRCYIQNCVITNSVIKRFVCIHITPALSHCTDAGVVLWQNHVLLGSVKQMSSSPINCRTYFMK